MARKSRPRAFIIAIAVAGAIAGLLAYVGNLPSRMLEEMTPVQFRPPQAAGARMRGPAAVRGPVQNVIDGDSLVVNGVEIRLHGIDAPELRQTCRRADGERYACGREARRHLLSLVRGRNLDCRRVSTDRYGRMIASCRAGGTDIARRMVQDGWALAFTRFSRRYVADERQARRQRLGLWAGRFVPPAIWRRQNR